MKIDHFLKDDNNKFKPDWEISHLLLGTFNPKINNSKSELKYFYTRQKNFTWKIVSNICNADINPNSNDFFDNLRLNKIACMDVIESIILEKEDSSIDKIIGKGYPDSSIFKKGIKRIYNVKNIVEIIEKNKNVNVYSTWGKGSCIKGAILHEWSSQIDQIKKFSEITELMSPSPAAKVPKGSKKFDHIYENWVEKWII